METLVQNALLAEYYPDSVIDSVIGNRAAYSTRFEFDERGIISIFGELVSEFKVRKVDKFAIFGHSGGANITKRIIFAYPELMQPSMERELLGNCDGFVLFGCLESGFTTLSNELKIRLEIILSRQ